MPQPKPLPPPADPLILRGYRFCLRFYPTEYRNRFGREMEMVFRDQWRAARAAGSVLPAVGLLFRTFGDLASTAVRERLAAVRGALNLREPISPRTRLRWSLGVGLPVAIAVAVLAAGLTLSMPRAYRGDSRILVRYPVSDVNGAGRGELLARIQNEKEAITSVDMLSRVVEKLGLNQRWGQRSGSAGSLRTPESVGLLRRCIEIRAVRNTTLLQISVYDPDSQLASEIANALAEAYLALSSTPNQPALDGVVRGARATLVDRAQPPEKPVRPNVPLNVALGLVTGGLMGSGAGIAAWHWLRRRSRLAPPMSPT